MKNIRVAIAGVGNCASSLIQGLEYYKNRDEDAFAGLMHARIGDWGPSDIEVVAAFDIDRRKVGKPVEEAIFAKQADTNDRYRRHCGTACLATAFFSSSDSCPATSPRLFIACWRISASLQMVATIIRKYAPRYLLKGRDAESTEERL